MAVNSIIAPYPSFFDTDGIPLENGYIYVGEPGFEAQSTPKASFFDFALTIPTGTAGGAAVRTIAGFASRNGAAAMIYVDGDFSITVRDRNGELLYSALNRTFAFGTEGSEGQPIQAPDGNFAVAGFGFIAEPNTGFVRQGSGIMQSIVQGALVSQQTIGGTSFILPVSGAGFVSGVAAALDPDLQQIAALPAVEGDMIYRNATVWSRRPKGAAGQIIRQNDALTVPDWSDAIIARAAQATTAGTAFDFTAVPAWVKRVTMRFAGISLSGTDGFLVQLGTASGFVTTGYTGGGFVSTGGGGSFTASTAGFLIATNAAAEVHDGHMTLTRGAVATDWVGSHTLASDARLSSGGGAITLAGPLTQVRLTRTGTDTFDAGSVSIIYE